MPKTFTVLPNLAELPKYNLLQENISTPIQSNFIDSRPNDLFSKELNELPVWYQ